MPSSLRKPTTVSHCDSQSCIHPGRRAGPAVWRPIHNWHVPLCLLLITGLSAILCRWLWEWFNRETGLLYVELQFYCAVLWPETYFLWNLQAEQTFEDIHRPHLPHGPPTTRATTICKYGVERWERKKSRTVWAPWRKTELETWGWRGTAWCE